MNRFASLLRTTVTSRVLAVVLAAYFLVALNTVFVSKVVSIIEAEKGLPFGFVLSIPVFLMAALTAIFTLFIWPRVTKPLFIFVILTAAGVNYGAYTFGIVFNKDMIQNIFETTGAEAASYLNVNMLACLFLTGIAPAILLGMARIVYKPFTKELTAKLVTLAVCFALIGGVAALYYKDYASIARNNPKIQKDIVPTYYLSSAIKYVKATYLTAPMPYKTVGGDAVRFDDPEKEKYLVVFLVGETARAQNYQWNGYDRPTNAYTMNIPNVVSFKNVSSCGTATAVSLPCMFSLLGKENYSQEKFNSSDSVVDILKRAGIQQTWIDNNTGCKGVCRSIANHATVDIKDLKCTGEECTDDVMLKILDDTIDAFKGGDGVVYLHLLGSHGPTYYKRYPRSHAKFLPDCETSDLQECTDEQIVNSYDNTILFTDYMMSKVIEEVQHYAKTYHTAVFYVSDHGESLGEKGVYLHGMPYPIAPTQQTHVPFMLWLSDQFIRHEKLDMQCLRDAAATGSFSHDNISPTLLNMLDIETSAYVADKDVLHACLGAPHPQAMPKK